MILNYSKLSEKIQKADIHNIESLNHLIEELNPYKLQKVKPYFTNLVCDTIFQKFSKEDVEEVIYSYLTEEGLIKPNTYLSMLAQHFGLCESPEFFLNYLEKHPLSSEKEVLFLCTKLSILSVDTNESIKKLETIYLNAQKEKPELFSSKFVQKMLGNGLFYNEIEKPLLQKKFIELNQNIIETFCDNHPRFIVGQKQTKMLRFLIKIGFDKTLKNHAEMAQDMIIFYHTSSFPKQAQLISDIVPLDKEHLGQIIKIAEKRLENKHKYYLSELSFWHPEQIAKLRLEYEKLHLEDSISHNIEEPSKKMKL